MMRTIVSKKEFLVWVMHDNTMIKITEEKLQHVQLMKTYGKYVVISQEKQRGMLKKSLS